MTADALGDPPQTVPNPDAPFAAPAQMAPDLDVDKLFPEKTADLDVDKLFPINGNLPKDGDYHRVSVADLFTKGSLGNIANAFGASFGNAFVGAQDAHDDLKDRMRAEGYWNDYEKGEHDIMKSFNEGWMHPALSAVDTFMATGGALFSGTQAAVAQTGEEFGFPQLAHEIAAIPESEFGSPFKPHVPTLAELMEARSLGVMGDHVPGKEPAAPISEEVAPAPAARTTPPEPAPEAAAAAPVPSETKPLVANLPEPVAKGIENLKIDATSNVRFGAAADKTDPNLVHVDKSIPDRAIIEGIAINPRELVAYHELSENNAMKEGKTYDAAHREDGVTTEKAAVQEVARQNGKDPEQFYRSYQAWWDDKLKGIEHEKPGEGTAIGMVDSEYPRSEQELIDRRSAAAQGQPTEATTSLVNKIAERLKNEGMNDEQAQANATVWQAYFQTLAQRWQGRKGTAEQLYDERFPTLREVPKPKVAGRGGDPTTHSLLQFLAAEGGLSRNSDLEAIFGGEGSNKTVQGGGSLIRKEGAGLDLSDAAALAKEAKYLRDTEGEAGRADKVDKNNLLVAIREEHAGRRQFSERRDIPQTEARGERPPEEPQAPQTHDALTMARSGQLSSESAKGVAADLKKQGVDHENAILGDDADAWRKAQKAGDRAWNRGTSEGDKEGKRQNDIVAAIENKLSPEDRDSLYAIQDPQDWKDLARDLAESESDHDSSAKMLANKLRDLPDGSKPLTDIDRDRLAIIQHAMDEESKRGGDPMELLKDGFKRSGERYGGGPDAQELIQSDVEKLQALMKNAETQERPQQLTHAPAEADLRADALLDEFFQRRGRNVQGTIRVGEGRSKMSMAQILKKGDASTFMHESSHDWLHNLERDAKDPDAPDDIKSDMATVKDWLGIKEDAALTERNHESFARGFEAYLLEGRAPSQALANVFAKFKNWLINIYKNIAGLKDQAGRDFIPINDNIRGVFNRLMATPDEARIEPEPAPGMGDIHERDANVMPPDRAHPVAEQIQRERDIEAAKSPENTDARLAGVTEEVEGRKARGAQPGGDVDGSADTAAGRTPAESLAERQSRSEAAAEGDRPPAKPGDPRLADDPLPPAGDEFKDSNDHLFMKRFSSSQDMYDYMARLYDESSGYEQARRGVVPIAQQIETAKTLGINAARLQKRIIGEAWNAEQLRGLKMGAEQAFDEARTAAQKFMQDPGNEQNQLAWTEAQLRIQLFAQHAMGTRAEAGRALGAMAGMKGFTEQAGMIADVIKGATGMDLHQMKKAAQMMLSFETQAEGAVFARKLFKPTFGDMVLEMWTNGLIAGLATHVTYTLANLAFMPVRVGEAGIAAGWDAARSMITGEERTRFFGETVAQAAGIGAGVPAGITAFIQSAKSGTTMLLPGEFESMSRYQLASSPMLFPRQSIPDFKVGDVNVPLGTVARLPSRGVGMLHSFNRAINYTRALYGEAYREAAANPIEGMSTYVQTQELLKDPPETLRAAARAEATNATLMSRGGDLTEAVSKLMGQRIFGFQPLKFIDPFVHVSSNIINQNLKRTPLGLFGPETGPKVLGREGGGAQADAIAPVIAGAAIAIGAGMMASQKMLNGSPPNDPKIRRVIENTDGPAHSIRIGDMWFSIQRGGAIGLLLSEVADFQKLVHHASNEDVGQIASSIIRSFTQNVLEESFMRGPADAIAAMHDPDRYGKKWVDNFITSFIPFSVGLSQAARAIDPYGREIHDLKEAAMAKIPWLSEDLTPRIDVFGRKIENLHSLGGLDGISAIYEKEANTDPVWKALKDAQVFPSMPRRTVSGVPLNESQYEEYATRRGTVMKELLDNYINDPRYNNAKWSERHKNIIRIERNATKSAASYMRTRYPQIAVMAAELKKAPRKMPDIEGDED